MNISQLKAFLGDKPQHLGNENSIQNQLRDAGLQQAIDGQKGLGADKFSSSANLGMKIYANALNNSVEVGNNKPNFSAPETEKSKESLFDFEEIAKNVLNFVGGAIRNAQGKGADDKELNELFEQASSGVLKGIKLAEQDLAGFLNEEISNGIRQSKNLIEEGIANLKQDIFRPLESDANDQIQPLLNTSSATYEQVQSGQLSVRTRDGDSVSITFDDFQKFEFNQRQTQSVGQEPAIAVQEQVPPKEGLEDNSAVEANAGSSLASNENLEQQQVDSDIQQTNTVIYQQNALSFSVQGELDEGELKAIGQLVSDANELAEEFFNGDIEAAFNQALELGFDEQELSSFALQLTKVENTQVIKAYETVSRFEDDGVDSDPTKAVKPVAEYLDKLLNVLDGARLKLEDSKSYENVINELINRLGEEVATPDLISAINRFNEFNQKLVNNLPIGYQPETVA